MDVINLDLFRQLAEFRARRGRALSLYLDLDPSTTPTAAELDSRISSLLREGRAQAESIDGHTAKVGLGEDLARIERFFEEEFERERARGVAVFSDGPDGLWRVVELDEPVRDDLRVGEELHVTPLAAFTARESALVAFVGREQGLLFALRDGRLEPVAEQFDEQLGRHDQGGWSQARYQRHIEHQVMEHLRDVAQRVDGELHRARRPLVVVGTEGTVASFCERLSVEARAALAGTTHAEAHATPAEILESVRPLLEEAVAARERDIIETWSELVGRDGRAAAGWQQTLAAASDGRVASLLYREGVERTAVRCPACGRIEDGAESCPFDGARMEPLRDGLGGAIRQTLAFRGELVPIRRRQDLDPVGGIGAILRF